MSDFLTMGSCLGEKQKQMNNAIQMAHRVADSYMSYVESNETTAYEQGVTAQLLNNFAERHRSYNECVKAFGRVSDAAIGDLAQGATHEGSFGPWVMDVWPLVSAWYPEFPLKDLISVQEMEKPLAWMFFSTLKAGTSKAPTVFGHKVETATGMREIKGQYPTGEVFGEMIVKTNDATTNEVKFDSTSKTSSAMLAYYPLNISGDYTEKILLKVTRTGPVVKNYVFNYVSDGAIYFKEQGDATNQTIDGLTLDINTGLIVLPEANDAAASTVVSIEANYVWNLDYSTTDNIPRVKEDVEKIEMVARERALMLEWTLFAEYLKKTQFGQDIKQDNLRRCLDLMYQYQVRYILDEMWTYAEGNDGNEVTITIPTSQTYSVDVKVQQLLEALNNTANLIEIASGRMAGNRIVVGRNFKAFLESLPNTYFKAEGGNDKAFSSPRKIGEIGGFMVYFDPFMANNKGFMTYRGTEFYDAAYYMGMYMPLTTTDTVVLGVNAKQSFVSMEAYKFHKKNCVIKLAFA